MAGFELVTLDNTPPLLSEDSALEYACKIADNPIGTLRDAQSLLEEQPTLHDFIQTMENKLANGTGNIWAPRILLLGAAVSAAAYYNMGFYPDIDGDVTNKVIAEYQNTPPPGIFLMTALADTSLDIIIDALVPHIDLKELFMGRSLLVHGAGMTRMFYRTALAA